MESISYSKDPNKQSRPEFAEYKKFSQAGFKIIKPYDDYVSPSDLINITSANLPILVSTDNIDSELISSTEEMEQYLSKIPNKPTKFLVTKPTLCLKDNKHKVFISKDSMGVVLGDKFLRVKNPYPVLFPTTEFLYHEVNSFLLLEKKSNVPRTNYEHSSENREKFKQGFLKGFANYENHNPRIYVNYISTNDSTIHGFYYGVYFGFISKNLGLDFSSEENLQKSMNLAKTNIASLGRMLSAYKHVVFEDGVLDSARILFNQPFVDYNATDVFADIIKLMSSIDSLTSANVIESIKDIDPDKNKGGLVYTNPQFRLLDSSKFRFQSQDVYRDYSVKFGDFEKSFKSKEHSNFEHDYSIPSDLSIDYLKNLTYDKKSNQGTSATYSSLTQKGDVFYDHNGNVFIDISSIGS